VLQMVPGIGSRLFDAALYPCIWDRPQPLLAAPARSLETDFE